MMQSLLFGRPYGQLFSLLQDSNMGSCALLLSLRLLHEGGRTKCSLLL
jgi:hypothetical protein